jgi:RNA polymerase sigma-70 factor (ECF subfamily)
LDSGSFDALVRRHRPEILAYLTRLSGHPADAEDLCQEALLRACRARQRLAEDANGRAWLYRIATNTALTFLKRRARQPRPSTVDPEHVPAPATGRTALEASLERLHAAVAALPPKQRAALVERRFQGLDYAAIGLSLGCTPSAARANVYQAMRRLRAALANGGDPHEP